MLWPKFLPAPGDVPTTDPLDFARVIKGTPLEIVYTNGKTYLLFVALNVVTPS